MPPVRADAVFGAFAVLALFAASCGHGDDTPFDSAFFSDPESAQPTDGGAEGPSETLPDDAGNVPVGEDPANPIPNPANTPVVEALTALTQSALPGTFVTPPSVRVTTQDGVPLANIDVLFRATGLTTVTGEATRTDADGIAAAGSWMLAPLVDTNRVIAEVGDSAAVVFTARGESDMDIGLIFGGQLPQSQRFAFERARDRWAGVLVNDLADLAVPLNVIEEACGVTLTTGELAVDDVVIFASSRPIDGPGGVLGQAGPCVGRDTDGSPALGVMEFDSQDLDALEAAGQLEVVILHEMAHVLGLGTLWAREELIVNPSVPDNPGADTHFIGANALAAFERVGGGAFANGSSVPVENSARLGSADGHWREAVFGNELMSPGLNPNDATSPLSEVTVASFADLGFYSVNFDAADPFVLPSTAGSSLIRSTSAEHYDLHSEAIRPNVFVN